MHVLRRSNLSQNDSADTISQSQAIKIKHAALSISGTEHFPSNRQLLDKRELQLAEGQLTAKSRLKWTSVDFNVLGKQELQAHRESFGGRQQAIKPQIEFVRYDGRKFEAQSFSSFENTNAAKPRRDHYSRF